MTLSFHSFVPLSKRLPFKNYIENNNKINNVLTTTLFIRTIITVFDTIAVMLGQNALAWRGAGPTTSCAVKGWAVTLIALIVTILTTITHSSQWNAALVITLKIVGRAGMSTCNQCFLTSKCNFQWMNIFIRVKVKKTDFESYSSSQKKIYIQYVFI